MNRKQFLKTGLIGMIVGFFAPKVVAKNSETPFSINKIYKKTPEEPMYLVQSSLCCFGKSNTKEQRDEINRVRELIDICHYDLEGTLEELIRKQHVQMLFLMARVIAEHPDNKHLNLDYQKLALEFKEKYKITNINT